MSDQSAGPPDEIAKIMALVGDYGYGCFLRDDGLRGMRWKQILDAVTRLVAERDEAVRNVDLLAAALVESEGIIDDLRATSTPPQEAP